MEILTLGNKIKNRRKELGLTLKELAGDRITPAQLSYVETDKCKPSIDLLEYIADRLGLEMDYLLESERKQISRYCKYHLKFSQVELVRGNYENARERLADVIGYALKYGFGSLLGEAYKLLGHISRENHEYKNAGDYYMSSLVELCKINDTKGVAEVYIGLALTAYDQKYYCSCENYLKQAERLVKELDDIDAFIKIKVCYYMMVLYDTLNDIQKALEYAEKTSGELAITGDTDKYCQTIMTLSKTFENQKKIDKAMEYIDDTLSIYSCPGNMELIAEIETNIGSVYSNCSRVEESFIHLYRALEMKKLIKDKTIPITLLFIAHNNLIRKDYEKSIDTVNEALKISLSSCLRDYEALAYYQLYRIFYEKGDYIKAQECIKRCADILEKVGNLKSTAKCYYEMARFCRNINREKEAGDFITKALAVYKNIRI